MPMNLTFEATILALCAVDHKIEASTFLNFPQFVKIQAELSAIEKVPGSQKKHTPTLAR